MTVKHSKESVEDHPMICYSDFDQKSKSHMNSGGEFQEFTDHHHHDEDDDDEMMRNLSSPHQKLDRCFSEKLKRYMELENENGCGEGSSSPSSSSEDFDYSPKSVNGIGSGNYRIVHHQVRKIREEDSHIGEDIGEGFNAKENNNNDINNKLAVIQLNSHVGALFWSSSRPILPSSPLSGKSSIKSFH